LAQRGSIPLLDYEQSYRFPGPANSYSYSATRWPGASGRDMGSLDHESNTGCAASVAYDDRTPGSRRVDCLGLVVPWFGMHILYMIFFCSTQTMLEAQQILEGRPFERQEDSLGLC
jgi:hypothetical protein